MLYYNARYYDPAIGRFISADSVVPGNASGGMGGVALRPLTVDFHEPGFVAGLNGEAANADKLHWGRPLNPQSLNWYSYVNNNPLKYTDPSGHSWYFNHDEAEMLAQTLEDIAYDRTYAGDALTDNVLDFATTVVTNLTSTAGSIGGEIIGRLSDVDDKSITKLYELAKIIRERNGKDGVALGGGGNSIYDFDVFVLDRANNDVTTVRMGYSVYMYLFREQHELGIGWAFGDATSNGAYAFKDDIDSHYLGYGREWCHKWGANDC